MMIRLLLTIIMDGGYDYYDVIHIQTDKYVFMEIIFILTGEIHTIMAMVILHSD